jgi:hypothetical protein
MSCLVKELGKFSLPFAVMPGHSRSQNGVASLAYGAGHPRLGVQSLKKWMAGTSPAMTRR